MSSMRSLRVPIFRVYFQRSRTWLGAQEVGDATNIILIIHFLHPGSSTVPHGPLFPCSFQHSTVWKKPSRNL